MSKTVTFRGNSCLRTDSPVELVDAADFTGDLDIYVENVGDYPLQVLGSSGGFILKPGRSIKFHVDAPVNLNMSAVAALDSSGLVFDYKVNACAIIEGEVL